MRRRSVLARAFSLVATGLSAGCVRGPGDVEVGTPSADQIRQRPLADCDLPAATPSPETRDGGPPTAAGDESTTAATATGATPRTADAVVLEARLLRAVRRGVPVVRSDASGFSDLVLFQRLFAAADDASPADEGSTVRTEPVPIESAPARRAIAAKECLPVPTYVVHGRWILSVALYRERSPTEDAAE